MMVANVIGCFDYSVEYYQFPRDVGWAYILVVKMLEAVMEAHPCSLGDLLRVSFWRTGQSWLGKLRFAIGLIVVAGGAGVLVSDLMRISGMI